MRSMSLAVLFVVGLFIVTLLYGGKLAHDITQQIFYRGCLTEQKVEKKTNGKVLMSDKCRDLIKKVESEKNSVKS